MSKNKTTFSDKLDPLDSVVDIKTTKLLGITARVFAHEAARKLPLYNEPIACNETGKDEKGQEIAVNTVGRWLFGVPGFQAHVRIVPAENQISLYYPKQSPKVVLDLLSSLKEAIENQIN